MTGKGSSKSEVQIQLSGLTPRPGRGDALNPAACHLPQRLG